MELSLLYLPFSISTGITLSVCALVLMLIDLLNNKITNDEELRIDLRFKFIRDVNLNCRLNSFYSTSNSVNRTKAYHQSILREIIINKFSLEYLKEFNK